VGLQGWNDRSPLEAGVPFLPPGVPFLHPSMGLERARKCASLSDR
jgi:hypothetical protein